MNKITDDIVKKFDNEDINRYFDSLTSDFIRLKAGEIDADTMLTVKAIVDMIKRDIYDIIKPK
jgi:ribosomal protein S17E